MSKNSPSKSSNDQDRIKKMTGLNNQLNSLDVLSATIDHVQRYEQTLSSVAENEQTESQRVWCAGYQKVNEIMKKGTEESLLKAALMLRDLENAIPAE